MYQKAEKALRKRLKRLKTLMSFAFKHSHVLTLCSLALEKYHTY